MEILRGRSAWTLFVLLLWIAAILNIVDGIQTQLALRYAPNGFIETYGFSVMILDKCGLSALIGFKVLVSLLFLIGYFYGKWLWGFPGIIHRLILLACAFSVAVILLFTVTNNFVQIATFLFG